MAEDKKSFILYSDLIHTVRKMPKEKAGELFLTILSYVNDENPAVDDILIDLVFEPIKRQMKRDLKVWESEKLTRKESGRLGGLKSAELRASKLKQTQANEGISSNLKESQANQAVNVNDTVNVTVKKENNIDVRKLKFSETLKPFLATYGKDFLNNFYGYWTEPNKSNSKFRMELEKTWDLKRRLETWAKNDKTFNSTTPQQQVIKATGDYGRK